MVDDDDAIVRMTAIVVIVDNGVTRWLRSRLDERTRARGHWAMIVRSIPTAMRPTWLQNQHNYYCNMPHDWPEPHDPWNDHHMHAGRSMMVMIVTIMRTNGAMEQNRGFASRYDRCQAATRRS